MTTDRPPSNEKQRRFSAVDCGVFLLAVCALAAPFAARLQHQAHASASHIAEPGEVSPIRPIDFAMGYSERQAEAAFFEGLEQADPRNAETALDLALALPPAETRPQQVEADGREPVSDQPEPAEAAAPEQPRATRSVAVIRPPVILDAAIAADKSDMPPVAARKEPTPKRADTASAPPAFSPLPMRRPAAPAQPEQEIARAELPQFEMTPPSISSPIEEQPLAPLLAPSEDVLAPPVVDDLPQDVTPKVVEVPEVTKQEAPPVRITNGPRIALVIAAAGLNENVTRFAIEALPEGVTLAFAPVKPNVGALAAEAKADGHTVLVEIPMEPVNKSRDPGPMTLRVHDTPAANLARLNKALARVPVAVGASSYLGARFNADERAAGPVMTALAQKGLFFFENEPTSRSVFQRLAARSDMRYARGIVKIDRNRKVSAIRDSLDALEKQARQHGYAVGVGTTLRGTIATVALWIKEAEKRGVRLVPVVELGG